MIINALNKDAHYFTLDVHGGAILTEPLKFKQHDDNSRVLAIELTVHDDVKVDLTNARVDIWVRKPDGHLVVKAIDQKNIDLDSSIVVIPLTRQMLAVPPSIQCEIVVTYANKSVLSFPIFEVEIEGSNVNTDEVISSSEFNLFYDALYRMEQWMRDYLTKYDIIDRAFKQKLEAMEQEKLRIIEEFEQLNASLITQNEIRFEELKQMTIGEFAEWFREAKSQFAYAGREIEKRFNELYEKIVRMDSEVEDILNDCQSNQQVIHTIRSDVEELKRQVDEEYRKMCQIYEDAQVKFQEMQNTFKANEANRQTTFETNEAQRQADFNNAQTQRTNEYRLAEDERNSSYETNEQVRDENYLRAETERQNDFIHNEGIREETFLAEETARNQGETTRRANEEERKSSESTRRESEISRQQAESERQQGYTEMREQMIEFDEIINPFNASISVSPNVSEKGSTVSEITAKWSYNKDIVSQLIDGVATAIGDRNKTLTGEFTTDKTVTLKATSKTNRTVTVSAKLAFKNGIYYGASSSTTYNSTLVNSLTKVLDENKARTITVNAGAGQYIYYSYPSRLGTALFNVGGFDGGFSEVARIQFTNASGYTEEYIIYKSTNANLGNTTIVIK